MSPWDACDIPGWLWPRWSADLGDAAFAVGETLQTRAPLYLRVNRRRVSREGAAAVLADDGIVTRPLPEPDTCLEVLENPRRLPQSKAFLAGLAEVQDASSQAAVARLPDPAGLRVLDYCAGGGGKALAIADRGAAMVVAHDVSEARMRDIPARAARARVSDIISIGAPPKGASFDLVVVDAPCSGSGTWRRTPEAKWALSEEKLQHYNDMQDEVLASAAPFVGRGGTLAYMTCSVLRCENADRVDRFTENRPEWTRGACMRRVPDTQGDGFFLQLLHRP